MKRKRKHNSATGNLNFIVPVDIYERDVMVHFGSRKRLKEKLARMLGKKEASDIVSHITRENVGETLLLGGGQIVMYFPKAPDSTADMAVLSHEIFHAAEFIMRKVGISLTENTDEAYAYLVQFLTKRILEAFPISFSCDVQSELYSDASLHNPRTQNDL